MDYGLVICNWLLGILAKNKFEAFIEKGVKIPGSQYLKFTFGDKSIIYYKESVIHYKESVIHYKESVIHYKESVPHYKESVI